MTLINFSIDGTTYQAEENMTWAGWCDSEYNTGGFENSEVWGVILRHSISEFDNVGYVICGQVEATDTVTSEYAYELYNQSACN